MFCKKCGAKLLNDDYTNMSPSSSSVKPRKKKIAIIAGIGGGSAIVIAAVIILMVILTSVKTPADLIKGKWMSFQDGQQVYLEFNNDGSVVFNDKYGSVTKGEYWCETVKLKNGKEYYRMNIRLSDTDSPMHMVIAYSDSKVGSFSTVVDEFIGFNSDMGYILITEKDMYICHYAETSMGTPCIDKFYHLTKAS